MIVLRLLLFLAALSIILSGGAYLFTGNRGYLRLAWQIARFVLFALLIFGALYLLERYVLIGWRVLT
ncbi:MAG: hypothetical protein LBG66_03925 [Gallionellaceae bacterium]|jgi:hypothetical protein|nr:hypothetical protein [Gallionellaceae bacterium]